MWFLLICVSQLEPSQDISSVGSWELLSLLLFADAVVCTHRADMSFVTCSSTHGHCSLHLFHMQVPDSQSISTHYFLPIFISLLKGLGVTTYKRCSMKQSERARNKAGNILFVSPKPDILFVRKFCQGYWHKNIWEQRRNLKADVSRAHKSSLSVRRKAEPRAHPSPSIQSEQ